MDDPHLIAPNFLVDLAGLLSAAGLDDETGSDLRVRVMNLILSSNELFTKEQVKILLHAYHEEISFLREKVEVLEQRAK